MGAFTATHGGGQASTDLTTLLAGRNVKWYRGHYARLNLICLLLIITMMTNGFDGSMMNNLQTLTVWKSYFKDPKGGTLGLFNAIQSIGGLAGLPFAPYLNDYMGRRYTIFLGSCIMLVGVALQTAAQNIGMFIGARFLLGFGLAFSALASPTLLTELAFPTHRAPLTSLFNTSWYLGSIVAAWTTYGTFFIKNNWAWRIPSLFQGIPSVLQVALILTIPESPRWLVHKGREEAARKVLVKYHAGGDAADPLVDFELNEIKLALALDREANRTSSWKSMFTERGNLRRMRIIMAIGFFSQWSGNGLVSYYLNLVLDGVGITSSSQQLIFNGVLQVFNLGTACAGALLVDRVGRRKLWLTSAAGMCFSYTLWTVGSGVFAKSRLPADAEGNPLHPNKAAGNLVLAMIFFYYAFYNIAMSALLVSYTVEILPFRIRSKGLMVMQLCVNAALVLNQYANPIALDALDWKYYIVYTVWLFVELVFLYFYIIETKGKDGPLPLEEIAALFDVDLSPEQLRERLTVDVPELRPEASATQGFDDEKKMGGEVEHAEEVSKA